MAASEAFEATVSRLSASWPADSAKRPTEYVADSANWPVHDSPRTFSMPDLSAVEASRRVLATSVSWVFVDSKCEASRALVAVTRCSSDDPETSSGPTCAYDDVPPAGE